MRRMKNRKRILIAGVLFALFLLFTAGVLTVDVKPIGPEQPKVGFATVNQYMFDHVGESAVWHRVTEWLGYIAILVALGFAVMGLYQWVKRKSIVRMDRDLIAIGILYIVVIAFYLFFELFIVNYRPVLVEGMLEASYPSSHTMIVLCVMGSAIPQLHHRIQSKPIRLAAETASVAAIVIMLWGRLASGVHWCTDIVGSILLSAALIMLYDAVSHPKSIK